MKRNPRAHYDGDGKWVIIFDHPRLSDYMWTGSGLKPGIKMWSGLRAKEFSSEAEANAEIRDIVLDHIIKYKDDFGQYIRGWPRTNPLMAKRGKTAYYGVPVEFIDRWPDSPRRNPLPVAAAMAIGAVAGAGAGYYYGRSRADTGTDTGTGAGAGQRHLAEMLAFDMGYEKVASMLGVRPRDFSQVVTGSPSGDIRVAWTGMAGRNSLMLIVNEKLVDSFPVEVQSRAGANAAIRAMWEEIKKSPGWQQ